VGRGLSELQKTILRLGNENRVREHRPTGGGGADVYRSEVLAEVYGFESRFARDDEGAAQTARRHFARQQFWPADVGESRYIAGSAAVCRAMKRLEDRGLVVLMQGTFARWAGADLTEAGVAEAERLSSKG